eukprot:scaffold283961_cov14-Tisochrysis_lutea.AAC.1
MAATLRPKVCNPRPWTRLDLELGSYSSIRRLKGKVGRPSSCSLCHVSCVELWHTLTQLNACPCHLHASDLGPPLPSNSPSGLHLAPRAFPDMLPLRYSLVAQSQLLEHQTDLQARAGKRH